MGCAARSNELAGLVREDAASLAPYMAHVIGSPTSHTPASGLVAALGGDDWHARRAAALAVRALVLALGPRVDSGQVTCCSLRSDDCCCGLSASRPCTVLVARSLQQYALSR